MSAFGTLVSKEIRDNLRDRRSLFFALLYGPVLLPLLMIGPMLFSINQFSVDYETPREIPVEGSEYAPNLIQFLEQHYIDATDAPEDYTDQLDSGTLDVVLEIPSVYPSAFQQGQPAELLLHFNSAAEDRQSVRRQLRNVLEQYHNQTRSQRFSARGIDERLFEPLNIRSLDRSEDPQELLFLAYLVPFLLMFSMLMGGYYLAVDTTAGERERRSLEPLLSLPLPRYQIMLGKLTAVLVFVTLAMVLPLLSAFALFSFLPQDLVDLGLVLGGRTFAIALLIHLPAAALIATFLITIAAFARDTKEAQTHLSFAMMLPVLPLFALQFLNVPRDTLTMLVPLLSQFQIMELAIFGNPVPGHFLLASTLSTLFGAVVLGGIAVRLYRRESMMGG